jgi:hypothetical protein
MFHPPFCNENNNDKGVNIMFPLVCGGLQWQWQQTREHYAPPPIFDSYNKDNDGEGLVPNPRVFNSYNEEGAKYCVSPYFWLLQ